MNKSKIIMLCFICLLSGFLLGGLAALVFAWSGEKKDSSDFYLTTEKIQNEADLTAELGNESGKEDEHTVENTNGKKSLDEKETGKADKRKTDDENRVVVSASDETDNEKNNSSESNKTNTADEKENGKTEGKEGTAQGKGQNNITTQLSQNSGMYEGREGTGKYNYGEALQKALVFYELQRSGDLPEITRCNWRGDSGLKDGTDAGLDLTGGLYDAGDHVKFNLPMAYTSTMLAWSVYEDYDSYVESGQLTYCLDTVRWVNDYLMKCHPEKDVFYYQVGDGGADHSWWGPAEVMQMNRPSYKVTASSPGSAVTAQAAASLASCSLIFKDTDSEYSRLCLKHAKELYRFATDTLSDDGYTAANGFYQSWSGFYDELSFAGTWLYLATEEKGYLDQARNYLTKTKGDYKWTLCWDDKYVGACLLLAVITEDQKYCDLLEQNLDYWTVGVNGEKIHYTPKGLAWLDQWGSLRYATTEAFVALVYIDHELCSEIKQKRYRSFAESQIGYALGDTGFSYEIGYGSEYPLNPHHRTAQGSYTDNMNLPSPGRHILYGALVGGPGSSDDYRDEVSNYNTNEVACDYNAGFVGALAKLYRSYGGKTLVDFGAIELPGEDELYVEACVNTKGKDHIEIKAHIYNISGWPARVSDDLKLRYFVDLSEVYQDGKDASGIRVNCNYSQGGTAGSMQVWNEEKHIYYVEVDFSGELVYPGGQNSYRKEVQFRMTSEGGRWSDDNDPSFADLNGNNGSSEVKAYHMALYDNGQLVFGAEPEK